MISVDYATHLTSKSNGSHGHWSTAAKVARLERSTILSQVDLAMQRLRFTTGEAFELRKVAYTGRFRGLKVRKTKMVRVLAPVWRAILDSGLRIHLTRYAEKPLDDDGLRRGFKHIRDGVADAFGIPDNDPRLTFLYYQVKAAPSRVNVMITWGLPLL